MGLQRRFEQKYKVDPVSGCWEWTATKNNKGYGMMRPGGTKNKRLAHRISWNIHNGEIRNGLCVLHKCDNPGCVNPDHLWLGTKLDNTRDMDRKGRRVVGINPNNRPPRYEGSAHPRAKLNEANVRLLRERLAHGEPLRSVARETGLNRKTLMNMRDRVTWRHVA